MIAEKGLRPRTEPLAAHVPADLLYVHATDLREAVRLARDLETWAEPVALALERRPGRAGLAERYETLLAVERTGLAERLGHAASDGVALVLDDPFVREGTDLALVFHVRSRALLLGALGAFEERARAAHPGTEPRAITVRGHEVRSLVSPDGRVSRFQLDLGDVLVLATSRELIERFVAVRAGSEPPLARSGDFRYLRGVYPFDPEAETAFVFVGDAFVARALSPRTRILESRRMAALADLQAVGFAQALHGLLEGRPAADTRALLASGLLREADLRHADGTPIRFDPAAGASSDRWGRVDALTPLAALSLDRVTRAEADAYDRFRETYQTYWRGFIDPIAARIRRTPDGRSLAIDARMLPLIEGTDYDDLQDLAGRARLRPPDLRSGLAFSFAVGDDASLRKDLDGLGRMLDLDGPASAWLGRWVAAGAASRSGLYDLALLDPTLPEKRPPGDLAPMQDEARLWRVLGRAPIWLAADVRNPLSLAATLAALRAKVEETAGDLVRWDTAGTYRGTKLVAIRPGPGAARELASEGGSPADLALYYATPRSTIVLSPDLGTLQEVIDLVLDGRGPRPPPSGPSGPSGPPGPEAQAALDLALSEDAPWLGRVLAGLLEADARLALRQGFRDVEVLGFALGGLPDDVTALERAARGYLGHVPASPQGGTFSITPEGLPSHSLYGTELRPEYGDVPAPGSPLASLVEALRGFSAHVAFEGEGRSRGLHASVSWRRR
jgi:hypothetical protein